MYDEKKRNQIMGINTAIDRLEMERNRPTHESVVEMETLNTGINSAKKERNRLSLELQKSCYHESTVETEGGWMIGEEVKRAPNSRVCIICLEQESEPYSVLTKQPFQMASGAVFNYFCEELRPLKEKVILVPVEDDTE